MAKLTGENINESYEGILKTINNGKLDGGQTTRITDALGCCSAISLGSGDSNSLFHGSLVSSGPFLACQGITTNTNVCVKGSGTIDNNLIVLGDTITDGLTGGPFLLTGAGTFNNGISFNDCISVCGQSNLRNTCICGNLCVSGTINSGAINSTGDITAFSTSDNRLKDNLSPIDSENFVSNLTGYEFDWNSRSKRSGKGKGILAQDLYNIDESLVRENSDGYLTVDYTSLIPVLIEEVKRLGKEIQELKKLN